MIVVPFSFAILLFLILTVAFVLAAWFLSDLRRPRSAGRTTKDHVLKCPICTHVYLETRPGEISKCPRCGSMNTEEEMEKIDLTKTKKEHRP